MKKIISLFVCFIMFTSFSFADSSIIDDILSRRKTNPSISNSLIYNALNRSKTTDKKDDDIKILTTEKEIKLELDIKNRSDNEGAYIKGLDISKWNGDINWEDIKKANIQFVIIRAGYGITPDTDKLFHKNIQNAISNNMIVGVYWFSYAYTLDMANKEAIACDKTISKYKNDIDLPVFWDFEYDSVRYASINGYRIDKSKASEMANIFCKNITTMGYRAGIYTNVDYTQRYFTKDVLSKYHTWIAQWSDKLTYKHNFILWQLTSDYYINNKRFDLNYLYYNKYEGDVNEKSN